MVLERESYNLGIVLLGSFNPVIITPQWLFNKKIIRETESETAKIELIHPEITRFDLEWVSVQITTDRVEFRSKRESDIETLRDLVVSIFNVLKETPIDAFGINHNCHFSLRSTTEYINFGYWLSPVRQFDTVMQDPRLLKVEYVENIQNDNSKGMFRLTITPSDLILDHKSVVFSFNHHFQNTDKQTSSFINTLISNWSESITKVNSICESIWNQAKL
jgi:hypothetical protein